MESGILVAVVIAVLVIAAAAFVWLRRNSPASTGGTHTFANTPTPPQPIDVVSSSAATEALPIPVSEVTPGVLAVLEIEQGPDAFLAGVNIGRHIEIRERRITIGRSPKQSDIQLYNVDDTSSVSRLHCTLEFHKTLKCFLITDEGSSSGTRVEGRAIAPHKGHSLKDGDLIVLGMLDKQGASLRFRTTYDAPTDRLRIEPLTEPKDTIRQQVVVVGRGTGTLSHDVFLSYSRRDRDTMHQITDALTNAGFTVWSDERLEPGSPSWKDDVQRAIEGAGCVVAIMSPDAKDSEWVSEELNYARIHKRRVFTVLARGDESNAIPFGLTGIQWIDMRGDDDTQMQALMQQSALAQIVGAVREHLGK